MLANTLTMKTIYLTLALLCVTFSFAQNRKTLLKEINLHTSKTINESVFPITKDSLQIVINNYLENDGFMFHSNSDSDNVYYKTLSCFGENQFIDKEPNRYNKLIARNFYITILLKAQNNGISPIIQGYLSDSYISKKEYALSVTSNGGTQSLPTDRDKRSCYYNNTIFHFNENTINRFLYSYFNGNNIPFPSELKTKIEAFNNQQTKEKRQLIAGRDF